MTMAMHRWRPAHYPANRAGATACGRVAWLAANSTSEAETALGRRLEVTTNAQSVTCLRCRSVMRVSDEIVSSR